MSSFMQGLVQGQLVIHPQPYPQKGCCHHVAVLLVPSWRGMEPLGRPQKTLV